jgi:uncharacterized protein YaaQ
MLIAHPDDATALIESLRQSDFRSTRLDTDGGFLKRGNATVFIGVDNDQVDEVLRIIQETCRPHTVNSSSDRTARSVRTSAATVMVLNVGRFERL